jgi:hypothetical protein
MHRFLVIAALLTAPVAAAGGTPDCKKIRWKRVQRGVHYAAVTPPCIAPSPVPTKDRRLHLVRVDPARAKLVPLAVSKTGGKNRTAARWARDHKLSVVINLGMYMNDHETHVGYTRIGDHVNSRSWVAKYLSALALHPKEKGARATMVDIAPGGGRPLLERHGTVVQNLRLIRSEDGKRGVNVWTAATASRRWSEAALALDRRGRLLFVFARAPYAMVELNRMLLELPLGVVRAQHLEGGPEASLSVHAGGVHLDLCGSYETGFVLDDSNVAQWPLPNVLGVAK